MYDRELKREPIRRESRKIGRNEKVEITNGTDTKTIKYKKMLNYNITKQWMYFESGL